MWFGEGEVGCFETKRSSRSGWKGSLAGSFVQRAFFFRWHTTTPSPERKSQQKTQINRAVASAARPELRLRRINDFLHKLNDYRMLVLPWRHGVNRGPVRRGGRRRAAPSLRGAPRRRPGPFHPGRRTEINRAPTRNLHLGFPPRVWYCPKR